MALVAALSLAPMAVAQVTPSDVRDLIGARGSSGEGQLASRGYVNTGGRQGKDRAWTFWWNDRSGTCLSVTTHEGRYESIVAAPAADCRNGNVQWQEPSDRLPPPPQGAERLALVCYGEGKKPAASSSTSYEWDKDQHRYMPKTRMETTSKDFDGTVSVDIAGNSGHIHLSKDLVPALHSDNDAGWWELKDVKITDDTIKAHYKLNGLNHPKLTIDRRSGRINIEGATSFHGSCDIVDKADHRRF